MRLIPVGKHMSMLHLLLELRSTLVEALGRVPQSEEASLMGTESLSVSTFMESILLVMV